MKMSWRGNAFHIAGPSWSVTRALMFSLSPLFVFVVSLNELLNKQWTCRWLGIRLRSCDVTVRKTIQLTIAGLYAVNIKTSLCQGSPGKSCLLDPIPTWLTKKCIEVLTPVITSIVNMSLSSAVMSADFKETILLPLLKKICLDPEIFNNFKPISNLMYISKLIQRVVASRLRSHLITNDLYQEYQSSYRKLHSTETALISVHDDILRAIDDKKCILLIMLDLSAAFDTVDHEILLRRLSCMLGISGSVLQWFRSYLTDRKQKVVVNDVFSKSTSLTCGVPQGSVLVPILFTISMLPLGEIIRSHGVQFHMYADDCQPLSADSPDLNDSISKIESLISDIRVWYSRNMLKLNDSKTEMLVIKSKFRQNFHFRYFSICESIISPSPTIRNLGVIMDPTYTMRSHVSHLVRVAFLKLRELSYFRRYLTDESTKTAVHAYITSRLDYCNSLLFGLPQEQTMKMQSVMNAAARLVTKTRKFDHITPVLRDLRWLPVSYRCQFKILLITFKCIHKLAPTYLCKRSTLKPKRGLRSDNKLVLDIPLTKLKL